MGKNVVQGFFYSKRVLESSMTLTHDNWYAGDMIEISSNLCPQGPPNITPLNPL